MMSLPGRMFALRGLMCVLFLREGVDLIALPGLIALLGRLGDGG